MKTILSQVCTILFVSLLLSSCMETKESAKIMPGEIWLDTDGNFINAHGGGMLIYNNTYYWYGEMKSGETYTPECNKEWGGTRVDVTGVSCYSSKDLINWQYEGNVLPVVTDNPGHDLHTSKVVERPKVVYNAKTKKFVMWMHIDSMDYSKASSGVATSDSPTGPFTYIGSTRPNAGFWPLDVSEDDKKDGNLAEDFETGQMARDMTIFVDDDGKAYHFYSSENNVTQHIAELSDDYLSHTGKYKRLFIDRSMEAAAVFKREGKYYFMASGCTAWDPNPARLAVAENIWGPWEELDNPCVGENAELTFISQSTYVIPVQGGKDAFIFMADRWNKDDLKDSRYIWLPIEFGDKDSVSIKWHDEWDLDIFGE